MCFGVADLGEPSSGHGKTMDQLHPEIRKVPCLKISRKIRLFLHDSVAHANHLSQDLPSQVTLSGWTRFLQSPSSSRFGKSINGVSDASLLCPWECHYESEIDCFLWSLLEEVPERSCTFTVVFGWQIPIPLSRSSSSSNSFEKDFLPSPPLLFPQVELDVSSPSWCGL